jgi:hypothetical protein
MCVKMKQGAPQCRTITLDNAMPIVDFTDRPGKCDAEPILNYRLQTSQFGSTVGTSRYRS